MKPKLLVLLTLAGMFNVAVAQTFTTKTTDIKVQGNSTMHKWSSTVSRSAFTGNIEVKDNAVTAISSAVLKVNAKDIKSDKDSDQMDSRTYKALNADQFPVITYEFGKTKSLTRKGNDFVAVTDGKLTIAGVTKNTTMTVTLTPLANGDLKIKGSDKVLFTNHGLKAPSFVAGTLKVDNEVDVIFDLTVKK
ncbi:YceI family protein [Leadbetterella sp. DM7]|uniref:YceI family protein n=1 Tax=Leadbetterella sp. DM7 TaxID=3235085 RepID=UPI00349E543B